MGPVSAVLQQPVRLFFLPRAPSPRVQSGIFKLASHDRYRIVRLDETVVDLPCTEAELITVSTKSRHRSARPTSYIYLISIAAVRYDLNSASSVAQRRCRPRFHTVIHHPHRASSGAFLAGFLLQVKYGYDLIFRRCFNMTLIRLVTSTANKKAGNEVNVAYVDNPRTYPFAAPVLESVHPQNMPRITF